MSEYQYYEFVAVDRPLDERQLDQLRALSTRADITPTSLVNTYQWGSFRGDPRALMEQYFDAFLYLANWGTRELMLRVPARLLSLETAQRYCIGDSVSAWTSGEYVLVQVTTENEEGDVEWGGEGVLTSILPVRSALMSGDLRGLYLIWLACVQAGAVDDDDDLVEPDDDVVEPPVPPGLGALSGSLRSMAEFLRIDPDLLAVAATASRPEALSSTDAGLATWVEQLSAQERDALLLGLLRGDDRHLRAESLRRARPSGDGVESGSRTAGALWAAAQARRRAREQAERDRLDRAAVERNRRAAATGDQRLAALAAEGERAWQRVDVHIAATKAAEYDVAVALLQDLRAIWEDAELRRRVDVLRAMHRNKPAFMQRLDRAGL